MKKAIQMGILILSFICTSGQMPYKKNPEVAVTKEVVAVQEEKVEAPVAPPKAEKRIGAAKRILRGLDQVENGERKGAARKVRQGVR